jgi:hypothetical protein
VDDGVPSGLVKFIGPGTVAQTFQALRQSGTTFANEVLGLHALRSHVDTQARDPRGSLEAEPCGADLARLGGR